MKLNIESATPPTPHPFALFQLGFRPFFLGALLYSVISIVIWTLAYSLQWQISPLIRFENPFWWHGHEMIFGYALAVVSGFLLTASKNWTGVQTIRFIPLAALFSLWLIARILPWIGAVPLEVAAGVDLLFSLLLVIAVTHPLYMSRQWGQVRIFTSKLSLIFMANLVFYLGLFDIIEWGERFGIYAGVYLIIALLLTLGRRVYPSFIENGVGVSLGLKNSKFLDLSSLFLLLFFAIVDLAMPHHWISGILAALLVLVHGVRFYNWYSHLIWSKPLVWVLMVGYGWIITGFLLTALATLLPYIGVNSISHFIALHAFTYGAIGIITSGMMARVSLGHTGRNIFEPPNSLHWIFGLLLGGSIARVILPLFLPEQVITFILISQLLWIISFALFCIEYIPLLIKPRVDNRPG